MHWLPKAVPRTPAILIILVVSAMLSFAGVSHLVTRFNANQQARGRKLYAAGIAAANAGDLNSAINDFRAALICEPANSQYQLSLGRALRDTGDPRRLEEAETYLHDLWQRTPEDGTINLALARLAARRGSIEDALRYYHNAMYGVWSADPDANRRKARLELIEFLLQKNARVEAQSELMTFAAALPPDSPLHVQAAALFQQDEDYRDAFAEYEQVLRANRGNPAALAGAGEEAFLQGKYRTAERYLRLAADTHALDATAQQHLETARLILATDPFVRRISDVERNRRIQDAWFQAGARLRSCNQIKNEADGLNEAGSSAEKSPVGSSTGSTTRERASQSGLEARNRLMAQWEEMKSRIPHLKTAADVDLPDAIMDLVFQIEQQTTVECGEPQGSDLALLLISRNREAADQ